MNLDEAKSSSKAGLTLSEAADLLERDPRTVKRAVERGELPSVSIGRRVFIPRELLLAMLTAEPPKSKEPAN
jgi:excisionase family DNA binding protein